MESWDPQQDPQFGSRQLLQYSAKYSRNFFQRTGVSVTSAQLSAIINVSLQGADQTPANIQTIQAQLAQSWNQELHGLAGQHDATATVAAAAAQGGDAISIDFYALSN